ncbi:MAG: 16S rRNA (guanine(966)-N(2))-methyltransferase RsmD [Elusimicrobiota bacterium]|jgi:16S rRNA (guanine(966)-N(2))-methyltransferase RsmD|nr:16S rRNA (guanine(966)-N(2))-methyltransferase RsmD [Elusimicrobiota bacterium]
MSLKVLAGEARGRMLKTLPQEDLSIRPMLGRMKKSVFDILQTKIFDCSFLDLYAGVGSVGIEALSRGAKFCVFAELAAASLKLIKQNINFLKFDDRAEIIRCDIIKDFALLRNKYDIVFAGPPYKDVNKKMLALTKPTLQNIVRFEILKEDSVLLSQRHKTEFVGAIDGLNLFRSEKYGDTIIDFYKLSLRA